MRRRKVVQWGMLYVAGAWSFLQGIEFLSDTYVWPHQLQQLTTLALLIGLPVVLVLAWYHGDRGQQRVTTAEFTIITLLLLIGGGALAFYQRNSEGDAKAALATPDTSEQPASPGAHDARPSLAVLPFVDLSQAKDQEYLGDGLAEEILNHLAQVPALRLVGRTSSFSFKGKDDDLRTIGSKLGVAHLLEGSVRKSGDRIRITAQLIAASDSSHLWSKTYDRNLTDVFAVQDEIARDVAQALSVKLDAVTLNTAQGGTTNVDAYDRYLRWRQLFFSEYWDEEHDRQRVRLAREAVALDPGFVLGWDALAESLAALATDVDGEEAERMREEAAQVRAHIAGLAPDHWIVKRDRAYALWREGKQAEAIALTREIMEGGPMSYERAYPYTELIFSVGYLDETVAVVEQLKAIEPLAMFISRDLQYDYTAARRIDDAEAEYQRSLSLDGNDTEPTGLAFQRMLARPDADPKVLRDLHGRLGQDAGLAVPARPRGRVERPRGHARDPARSGEGSRVWWKPLRHRFSDGDRRCAGRRRPRRGRLAPVPGILQGLRRWQPEPQDLLAVLDDASFQHPGPSGVQEIADPDGGGRLLATKRPMGRRLQADRRGRFPVRVTAIS